MPGCHTMYFYQSIITFQYIDSLRLMIRSSWS
jgi:hypothetical protein